MAGEIQFDHTTAKTCYVQVRNGVGQIWNTAGAAFEAYQTANIADYDIVATEQGTASGVYVADMPAVAQGIYGIVAKERAGGSPAESDVTVGVDTVEWDGTAMSSILSSSERNAIATATLDLTAGVETGLTLRQALRLVVAAAAGKLSGAATTTIVIRNAVADSKDRITATVDASGNRSAITVDLT